jgi:Spy/CpxP family protein refolding chaperone
MQNMTPEQRDSMRARMQRGQQNMTPEQRQQMRERMQNMTPEQRAAMRSQMQDRQAGARGERGARGARQVPAELRPVMEQIRANQQAAMQEAQSVLTPEQRTRFRELAQQRRGQMGERMNRRPIGR